MDQQDLERVNKQLEKTFKAVSELNIANNEAALSIRELEYELKLMEQKMYEMEKSWREKLDV